MNKTMKQKLFLALVTGVGLTSFAMNPIPTYAESILKAPKAVVADKGTVISSKYDFIANYNDKTAVKPFGEGWKETEENGNGIFVAYTLRNPSDDVKGKVGMLYENVGFYNGKQIDLKITVLDWDIYNTKNQMISYSRQSMGHAITGYSDVKQTWEYIEHDTGKSATDIKGTFMNFNDIDFLQRITFDKETSNQIETMFVSQDSWIDYENKDGAVRIQDISGEGSQSDDGFAMVTTLFNTNKITFDWGADLEKGGEPKDKEFDPNLGGGAYFNFIAKKPARTEPSEPTKTVTDSDEKNQEENTLHDLKEVYSYTLYHNVPEELEDFYYDSYEITDEVIPELEPNIKDLKVLTESDEDVTGFFDNQSKDNKVHLVAKPDSLTNADFYGHSYRVEFGTKIREGANLDKYKVDKGYELLNSAKVLVNGESKDSNTTKTKIVPEEPKKESTIEKFVKKGDKQEKEVESKILDVIDFVLPIQVTNDDKLDSVVFYDDLDEKVFDVVKDSIKIYSSDEKEVTDQWDLGFDEATQKATLTAKEPNKWASQQLVVSLSAKLKDGTFEDYLKDGKYQFKNVGNIVVNDKDIPSNEVLINVPEEPKKEVGKLPQTGTDNTRMIGYTLVGLGLVSASAYGFIRFKKAKID